MIETKKRKNMKHFSAMNDFEFCNWVCLQKPIASFDLSWKLDGFFLRFGKDKKGDFWFQTARSPVLRDPMECIWYAIEKGYDHDAMTRAENYFHLLKALQASVLVKDMPEDSGFECEVFDKAASVLDKDNGTRTFVNIPYSEAFFTKDITLCLYRLVEASTGREWINNWGNGYAQGDLSMDPKIGTHATRFFVDVSMTYFQEAVQSLGNTCIQSLRSQKQADRTLKLLTKEKVEVIKRQFEHYVLAKAAELNTMGPNFEGVVIWVNNCEYKITTDYFKALMTFRKLTCG